MKIGIEKSLHNIREYLEQNNQQVSLLDENTALKKFDAIVVSGMDSNFLGMHDTSAKTPVVSADGKTAEEVYREIQNRMKS